MRNNRLKLNAIIALATMAVGTSAMLQACSPTETTVPGIDASTEEDTGTTTPDTGVTPDSGSTPDTGTTKDATADADASMPPQTAPLCAALGTPLTVDDIDSIYLNFYTSDDPKALAGNCKIQGFFADLENDPDPDLIGFFQNGRDWYSGFLQCGGNLDGGLDGGAAKAALAEFRLIYAASRASITNADFTEFKGALEYSLLSNGYNQAQATVATTAFETWRSTYVKSAAPGLSHSMCPDAGP